MKRAWVIWTAAVLVALTTGVFRGSWTRRDAGTAGVSAAGIPPVEAASSASTAQTTSRRTRNAYFGDLHVHTSWSLDAYAIGGNQKHDPAAAYRYARGEAITDANGVVLDQLRAPLDFMAVTDHDKSLGEVQACEDQNDSAYNTTACRELRAAAPGAYAKFVSTFNNRGRHPDDICGPDAQDKCVARARDLWQQIQKNADAFYQPGRFTTFAAFEWTGQRGTVGAWLHRNVIFRGARIPPWGGSAVEMRNSPERLWEWLETACTGDCQVVVIPHNSNWGMGVMLAPMNSDGTPFTPAILKRRANAERLIEMHQIKGNSECALGLGTTDEDCNFELSFRPCKPGEQGRCAFASDYVRNALKTGLAVEAEHGINPFKYGIIGSTDTHASTAGATEEKGTWPGGQSHLGGKPTSNPSAPGDNPGGLAGVWAEVNTREAIFDALKRRETFGTSGTRMRVRFFGGWKYPADLHRRRNLVDQAYRDGVPMGADLPSASGGAKAPRFVVWATKEAGGANLQKIQIIKGWIDGRETAERVYDIACAAPLTLNARTGRCEGRVTSVNESSCDMRADEGSPELSVTWADPDFALDRPAFYYARVFENATCRWSTRRAIASGAGPSPAVPATVQERAWSSPIWYAPRKR